MKNSLRLISTALALTLTGCTQTTTPYSACQNINGTWKGTYTDPQELFSSKPQPITVVLVCQQNIIRGTSQATNLSAPGAQAVSGTLWATYQHNKINNVFLGKNNQCGHYAPSAVIHENTLTLYLPYENAMTGTNFEITLSKISNNINSATKNLKLTTLNKAPQSCH